MTENRPGLAIFQRCRWQALSSFAVVTALSLGVSAARADGTMTLTFNATRAAPVCTLTSDKSTVVVPNEAAADYQSNKDGNNGGNTFRLTVGSCTSLPGVAQAKIAVYGDRAGTSGGYGFRSGSSTSTNIGFFFRYNATKGNTGATALSGSAPPDMTTLATAKKLPISGAGAGVSPAGKTMDLWVGLTTDGYTTQGKATAGTLTANMHFDVVFE